VDGDGAIGTLAAPLHTPALPAWKIENSSNTERGRLYAWTSSITPFHVRQKPEHWIPVEPIFHGEDA
jgi:hypothetical protein